MMQWAIYYRDREYAREQGDPLLGMVEAETKEQAERLACAQGLAGVYGVWAWPVPVETKGNPSE